MKTSVLLLVLVSLILAPVSHAVRLDPAPPPLAAALKLKGTDVLIFRQSRAGIIAILIGFKQVGDGAFQPTALPGTDGIVAEVDPGDGGLGLLLPAVQKVRAAAARL